MFLKFTVEISNYWEISADLTDELFSLPRCCYLQTYFKTAEFLLSIVVSKLIDDDAIKGDKRVQQKKPR